MSNVIGRRPDNDSHSGAQAVARGGSRRRCRQLARRWLFGLRLWASVSLALYVAFWHRA